MWYYVFGETSRVVHDLVRKRIVVDNHNVKRVLASLAGFSVTFLVGGRSLDWIYVRVARVRRTQDALRSPTPLGS